MDERQRELLKEIVESYIKSVKPVGSQALCKKFKLSSATIRNEMAALEKLGYIEKNHVSSGRVPSERGYKYYVEHLMQPKELNGEEMLKLQTICHNQQLQVSDAIAKCMEIIADITNYTSVVLGKNSNDNNLQQVNIISKTINQYEKVYEIFYDAFNDFTKNSANVYFSGKTNILKQPEYDNIEEIKRIVNKFEDESLVRKIECKSEGINVYIGEESEFDPNVTIIKSKYNINGEEGTIAIVGPKRMEYDRVIGLLEYINEEFKSKDE